MINYFLLPLCLLAVGLFLLIKLRFFFVIHPIRTIREICEEIRDRESRRSLMLALAGTLGVGNIFGVSAGILIGGAGSVFWIFISSFFSMAIKYAETLLAYDSCKIKGGTAETVRRIFPRWGRTLSLVYAFLTVALALFMGGAMQSSALVDVAYSGIGLMPAISIFILLILLLPCLLFGVRKIEKITEIIIPLTTIIYIIMCFTVIFCNFHRLGDTFLRIFSSAFSFKGAIGGIIPLALSEGFSRGILSNEGGIGSSATAHLRGGERTPHRAGLFGILEVFFDTTLLCTLTGIAILVSVGDLTLYDTPMALVSAAFCSTLGGWSVYLLTILILSFAYATIGCWYFYGRLYSELYIPRLPFAILFVIFLIVPLVMKTDLLIFLVDIIIFLMALITLSAIIKGTKRIVALSLDG